MKQSAMRPGNRRAFNLVLDRLRKREPTTSVVKPTRYGKRDLIITIALQAVLDSIVSGALVFSPAAQATRQFFKQSKLLETIRRYDLSAQDVLGGIRQLESFSEYQPFSNGEFLLAANIQLCLRTNIDDAIELIEAEQRRTGKPLVVFIDECQFLAERKRWGEFFRRVQATGALLVLLTATPYREDADAIPGFRTTEISSNDERRYFAFDAGDGVHNRIDVWDGVRSLSVLEPDDITTFREAWEEIPTVLCKLDRETVTVDVDGKPLRDLSIAETRKCLGKIVRDERFLDPALRIVLDKLQLVQTVDPRAKGMIMIGNDQPNDNIDNRHAVTIKKILTEIAPTILGRACRVRVITLKTLEDALGAEAMDAFLESEDDLVLVKQIGTVGLDDWRIKVLGYFSPIRSVAAMIQAWMRPATPEGGLNIAHLVMPEDRFCTAVWNKLVVEEGGEAKLAEMSEWTGDNLFASYLKEKEEQPSDDALPFGPGVVGGFDDSRGNIGSLQFYDEATRIIAQLPKISQAYTKAEVAVGLAKAGRAPAPNGPTPLPWAIGQQLDNLRTQINSCGDDKATHFTFKKNGGEYNQRVFADIRTKMFTYAYKSVGVPFGVKLGMIKNLETLLRIQQIIESLGDESF